MRNNLTPKQEKFAQAVVAGESLSDAYRMSYKCDKMSDNAINVQASKLSKDPKIALRVDELRKPITEALGVTVETITNELDEAIAMSRTQEDPNALTKAVMAKAKIHGLDVNKNANTDGKGNDLPPEKPLSEESAIKLIESLSKRNA